MNSHLPAAFLSKRSPRSTQRGPANADEVEYGVAATRADREASFRLVHTAYTRRGLMCANAHAKRITPYHLLPTTSIFNALHHGQVIYTMSLISAGELGVPAQTLYPRQIIQRLRQDIRLAEVTCLASQPGHFGRNRMFEVFVRLVGLMFQFARQNEIDRLVIIVHPKQQRFYERCLGFRQIGERLRCPWVCHQPAIVLEHDFELCDSLRYRLYDQAYGHRYDTWELHPRPISTEDRSFFAASVESFSYLPYEKSA